MGLSLFSWPCFKFIKMTRVAELVDAVNSNRGWVGLVKIHHRELLFGAEGSRAGWNPAPGHQ